MVLSGCRRSCALIATVAAIVAMTNGCGSTDTIRTEASTKEVETKPLPPMPAGASPRTLSVDPFVMSRLVTVAPEITLTSTELCELVTDRAKREFSDSQQFQIVGPGQPADYILRGEVVELMIGPETNTSWVSNIFTGNGSGKGSEASKVRPLDMMIEAQLIDSRTGAPVLRGSGASKRDIRLSQTVTGAGSYTGSGGDASTTMTGYKFDQQHLADVFRVAANDLAVKVCQKANTTIFLSEAQARSRPASGVNAAAFNPK